MKHKLIIPFIGNQLKLKPYIKGPVKRVTDMILFAGLSKNAPPRDYSLESSKFSMVMSAFTSISIIAAIFGNGIVPEIQVSKLIYLYILVN